MRNKLSSSLPTLTLLLKTDDAAQELLLRKARHEMAGAAMATVQRTVLVRPREAKQSDLLAYAT